MLVWLVWLVWLRVVFGSHVFHVGLRIVFGSHTYFSLRGTQRHVFESHVYFSHCVFSWDYSSQVFSRVESVHKFDKTRIIGLVCFWKEISYCDIVPLLLIFTRKADHYRPFPLISSETDYIIGKSYRCKTQISPQMVYRMKYRMKWVSVLHWIKLNLECTMKTDFSIDPLATIIVKSF